MKAIILDDFGDVSNFRLTEFEAPVIKANEVLIRLKATAFNPIDYQMRQGRRESRLMKSPILGRELSGIIIETGAEVKDFVVGDEVIAVAGSRGSNGSYAELMALNYKLVAHKPSNVSFEVAAAIPSSGLTAWQCFSRMNAGANSTVFITGAAGGVGRFLINILKAHGINNIIATAGNEQSAATLADLGLSTSQIINYNDNNLQQSALNANNGNRFDFAVDIAGGTITETAAALLKLNGTYLDVTFLATEITRQLLFENGCVTINICNYAYALNNNDHWYSNNLKKLTSFIEQHKINPPAVNIIGSLQVTTVQQAHQLMEANQIFGKKLVMSI